MNFEDIFGHVYDSVNNKEIVNISDYDNWTMHDSKTIKQDFDEYIFKEYSKWQSRASFIGSRFPIFENMKQYEYSLRTAKVITVDNSLWSEINNLSKNTSIADVKEMVAGYNFPRDVDKIINGFQQNEPIPFPVILKGSKELFIMSGNTRLNVARLLGITPKALLVDVSE